MIDESGDRSRPGAAIYVEDPAKKNRSDALQIVMAALAAAGGIHAIQPDTHSPSPDSLPSPRPIVGQPSEEYLNREPAFVMPAASEVPVEPTTEVIVEAQVSEPVLAQSEDTSVDVQEVESQPVYLPAVEKGDQGPSMEEILAAEVSDSKEQDESSLDMNQNPTATVQTAPTATVPATARPTRESTAEPVPTEDSVDQESVKEIVKRLKEETGISLILVSDFLKPDELGAYIAKEKSAADDAIQKIVAQTILDLPKKVRSTIRESSKRIVITRNIPDPENPISPGEVGYLLFEVSNVKGEFHMLDVFDGPTFEESETTRLPSDLTPHQEVKLVTYHAFITNYLKTKPGYADTMQFFMDNLDFPTKNPQNLTALYTKLGYTEEATNIPLEELLARMAAWNHIGRVDVIDAVKSLGVIDVSHLPSFQ